MNRDDSVAHRLQSTDDPVVWAEAFCMTFNEKIVTPVENEDQVDPGVMIGWFANAMQAGVNQYERRRLKAKDELSNIFEGKQNNNPT